MFFHHIFLFNATAFFLKRNDVPRISSVRAERSSRRSPRSTILSVKWSHNDEKERKRIFRIKYANVLYETNKKKKENF